MQFYPFAQRTDSRTLLIYGYLLAYQLPLNALNVDSIPKQCTDFVHAVKNSHKADEIVIKCFQQVYRCEAFENRS